MVAPKQEKQEEEGEWLTKGQFKNLLSQKTKQVSEIPNKTEYRPVSSPQTEVLLAGIVLERQVSLSEWNQHHNCVVYQAGQ